MAGNARRFLVPGRTEVAVVIPGRRREELFWGKPGRAVVDGVFRSSRKPRGFAVARERRREVRDRAALLRSPIFPPRVERDGTIQSEGPSGRSPRIREIEPARPYFLRFTGPPILRSALLRRPRSIRWVRW